jgi:hypothetical protein
MIVKGLSERQKEALRRFLERLPDDPGAEFDPDAGALPPREVVHDGIEFEGRERSSAARSAGGTPLPPPNETTATRPSGASTPEDDVDDSILRERARAFVAYATLLPPRADRTDRKLERLLHQAQAELLDLVDAQEAARTPPSRRR